MKLFNSGINKEVVEMKLNKLPIGGTYAASYTVSITQTDNGVFTVSQNGFTIGENLSFVETVMLVTSL